MRTHSHTLKPLVAALAGMIGSAALAASNNATLEEVVVTAQKREQSLQDVPISISAFGAEQIDQANMKGATDYLQSTPNVSFTEVSGQGPKGLNISIRGISDLQNAERVSATSAFGVYVDEFSVGTAARGTPNPPLYDIERIEVLRGPQGTYFGRNSTGGAINITTKKPDSEMYGRIDLGAGSYDTYSVAGVINMPVTDTFFVRAVLENESSGGQIKNVSPLSDGGDSGYENRNIRLAAHWDISDKWSTDFSLNTITEDSDMENRVSVGIEGRFGSDLSDPLYTCGLSITSTDKACRDTTGYTDLSDEIVNVRVNYTGDDFAFTSITGRSTSKMKQLNDLDGGGRAWVDRINSYNSESVSQEFRLQNSNPDKIEWTVGVIAYEDTLKADNRIIIKDFLGPWMANDYANENVINLDREGWATFGDLSWHINDSFTLTVGARYSDDEETQNWTDVYAACGKRDVIDAADPSTTPLGDGCQLRPDQMNSSLPIIDGSITGGRRSQTEGTYAGNSGTDFSPRLALNWDLNDDWTLYSVYSQGYKSAGARANPDSGGSNTSQYDKEKLTNIELGFKAEINEGRTRISGAIFNMGWDDFQTTLRNTFCREADGSLRPQNGDENCEFVPLDRIQNAEEASATGLEVSIDTLVGENWRFGADYGYLDAKYENFKNAVLDGQQTDLSGYTLPNAPENTASLRGTYNFNVGEADAYVRLEANYRDTVFNQASISDASRAQVPFTPDDYWLVHLRAGVEWKNQRVSFNINNLLDEEDYITSAASGSAGVNIRPHPTSFNIKWTAWTN